MCAGFCIYKFVCFYNLLWTGLTVAVAIKILHLVVCAEICSEVGAWGAVSWPLCSSTYSHPLSSSLLLINRRLFTLYHTRLLFFGPCSFIILLSAYGFLVAVLRRSLLLVDGEKWGEVNLLLKLLSGIICEDDCILSVVRPPYHMTAAATTAEAVRW